VIAYVRTRMSYANVIATLALLVALGGTSYAVSSVRSRDVVDNSLRSRDIHNDTLLSRDIHNQTIRARDMRRESLGSRVIRESTLGVVPRASDADRIGGITGQDLRLKCPPDTLTTAGVCIETSARSPDDFITAVNRCTQAGRGLVTMPQLDPFVRSNGALPQPEWTASVYRNPDNGPTAVEQLEAVVLHGGADVSYDRVHLPVAHAFRCAALPSN
jgi:hypothetical protein